LIPFGQHRRPAITEKMTSSVSDKPDNEQVAQDESSAKPLSSQDPQEASSSNNKRKASADFSHGSSRGESSRGSGIPPLPKRRKTSADLDRKLSVDSLLETGRRKASMEFFEQPASRKSSAGSEELYSTKRKSSGGSSSKAQLPTSRKSSIDSDEHSLGMAALGSIASSTLSEERARAQAATAAAAAAAVGDGVSKGSGTSGKALDHLDVLGDDHGLLGNVARAKKDEEGSGGSGGTMASSNQRLLMEALMISSGSQRRRDRFESWGGMSDLSVTGMRDDFASSDAAAAFAASALHETGILGDVAAAANSCNASATSGISEEAGQRASVPSRISLTGDGRDRKMSLAELSAQDGSGSLSITGPDLQAFIQGAMMTVGDQLAELAGAVEYAAAGAEVGSLGSFNSEQLRREAGLDSDVGSSSSPLIGAVTERELAMLKSRDSGSTRGRSSSTSSRPISVDYDAVAAAVTAAQAATSKLDLSSFGTEQAAVAKGTDNSTNSSLDVKPAAVKSAPVVTDSAASSEELAARRARARAAAGYVPPSAGDGSNPISRPLKKRPKVPTPDKPLSSNPFSAPPEAQNTPGAAAAPLSSHTPKISNASKSLPQPEAVSSCGEPETVPSSEAGANSSIKDAAQLKWDEMFGALLQYIQGKKDEALKNATQKQRDEWEWDGNVPTNYKTKDGKALGRWINNQRSAKSKGTLKYDREEKLVDAGLKWCVIATNAWDVMFGELKKYVEEQEKGGREWDGNVPTSYRVNKDVNLGRWVNRQRSNYQAGKLKEDRIDVRTLYAY
jgi:hypothetical protein